MMCPFQSIYRGTKWDFVASFSDYFSVKPLFDQR